MTITTKEKQKLDELIKGKGCQECTGNRQTCKEPRLSRPGPEAMAVDVYSTVRQFGFPINVRTDYQQTMDRYAFLMVR